MVLIMDFVKHLKLDHTKTRHFGQSSSLTLLMSAMGEGESVAGEIVLDKKHPFQLERTYAKQHLMNVNRRKEYWNVHPGRSSDSCVHRH